MVIDAAVTICCFSLSAAAVCAGLDTAGALMTPMKFAQTIPSEGPIAFVFGANAVDNIDPNDHPYVRGPVFHSHS